jgi:FKBP-type peptidyl-prolyl cis-trans isomerase
MRRQYRGPLGGVLAALLVALVAACGSDPTVVEFEVIENSEFSAVFVTAANDTLAFNLAAMTEMGTGIYFQDVVVGTGDTAVVGDSIFTRYNGWLRDGTRFDAGSFGLQFGNQAHSIGGYQLGMQGQQVGGTRLIVIPPEWAYGSQGVGPIYPGAIVVFEIQLDSIHPAP